MAFGRLQASGPISFNDINLNVTAPSGTSIGLNETIPRAFAGARTAGSAVSLGSMYNRAVKYILSPYVSSPVGNGVTTATLTLNNGSYFDASQVPTGSAMIITTLIDVSVWSTINPNPTYTFTMGTSSSPQTGGTGGSKNWYMQTIFGGTNVRAYGYYSGSSTSFPNGRTNITVLSLI